MSEPKDMCRVLLVWLQHCIYSSQHLDQVLFRGCTNAGQFVSSEHSHTQHACMHASAPPPPPTHTHTHTHTRLPTIESVFWSALFACSFFPRSFTSPHLSIRNARCSFLCCKRSFDVTGNILYFYADLCIVFLCTVLFTLI